MPTSHTSGTTPNEISPDRNLLHSIWERGDTGDHRQAVRYHADGVWQGLTWPELAARIADVAAGLINVGIQKGDRIVLSSPTRLEWTIADLAILAVGGVTVPIFETSSAEQCAWILSDSGAKAAFAATADLAKTLESARGEAPDLGEVFVFDDGGLDALAQRATDSDRSEVRARSADVRGEDLFSLIYTSGTTGNPKGCMLTHGHMLWTASQSSIVLQRILKDEDSTLLFLPLAHVFARLVQFLCLEAGVTLGYSRGIDKLAEDLPAFRPTFLLSVPRVFEKIFNGAQRKATGAKRKVFDFAVQSAFDWSEAVDAGRSPSLLTNLKHGIADKLVYAKLRDAMGGRAHHCVSGGAPLPPYLAHFFHAAGITILEGYGLTETTAPATVNSPDAMRIGTVGKPLPGVDIRIADDGEIVIRGGNVFSGYFHNDEATAEVIDDEGWFHTGDLGELDPDGFLKVTGRKKEIIVTAGGKNVAPAVLEERLKANRLISQAMVVGDNRPFVGALITLEPEELTAFAAENGVEGSPEELAQHEVVRAEIDRAVAKANEAVSRPESIRNYQVLDRDFSEEKDELTPTLKLRRAFVADHFADEIESLYTKS
jgi:long-chain acyl-CoA synthetase